MSRLAKAMLTELADLLPEDCKVYVLSDSWYASAKLINFCLRHKRWQVICALKSNRRLGKVRVDFHNHTLRLLAEPVETQVVPSLSRKR